MLKNEFFKQQCKKKIETENWQNFALVRGRPAGYLTKVRELTNLVPPNTNSSNSREKLRFEPHTSRLQIQRHNH